MTTRTSIYDRISERRLAQENRQRQFEAVFPTVDFNASCAGMVRAWIWLPCGVFDSPLPASELSGMFGGFTHDSRLINACGLRQPISRLATPAAGRPEVGAFNRCSELLHAALNQWSTALRASIDWSNTQVVLFVPDAVSALDWFDRVVYLWPPELSPMRGFDLQMQAPAQWLAALPGSRAAAQFLLCLSVDSWACEERVAACAADEVAGEAVCAVLLRRQPQQLERTTVDCPTLFAPISLDHGSPSSRACNDTQAFEQMMLKLGERTGIDPTRVNVLIGESALDRQGIGQLRQYAGDCLPRLDLNQPTCINPIRARFGTVTQQWVQIGFAGLIASADADCVVWLLDRTQLNQPQGWLIG